MKNTRVDIQKTVDLWAHGAWAVSLKMTLLILSFLVTLVTARLLDPGNFACLCLGRLVITFIAVATSFGFGTAALQLIAMEDASTETRNTAILSTTIIQRSLCTACGIGTFASIAVFCIWNSLFHTPPSYALIFFVIAGGIAAGQALVIADVLKANGQVAKSSFLGSNKGVPLALATVIITMVLFPSTRSWQFGTALYAAGGVLAWLIGSFFVWQTWRESADTRAEMHQEQASHQLIWKTAWPLGLIALLSFITTQGDQFLTGAFANPDESTSYFAARRVVLMLVIPLSVVNLAARGIIGPLFFGNEKQSLEAILQGCTIATWIPSFAIAICCLLAPSWVLAVLLGPGYEDAAAYLQLLTPGQLVMASTGSCSLLLSLTGHERSVLAINLVALLTLFMIGLPIAVYFGGIGLAIFTSTLIAFQNVFAWRLAFKKTAINTMCWPTPNAVLSSLRQFKQRKAIARQLR